jgi:hypothetical protein
MTSRGYLKSSPVFFRLIKISMALLILVLLILAALIPAPLQEPANLARVPNPVKSAWFLLWIQELVSYSKYLVNLVLALVVGLIMLPWLTRQQSPEHAEWLRRDQMAVNLVALLVTLVVGALTVVGMFFRGGNWALVLPF